jgi:hypothetical protein
MTSIKIVAVAAACLLLAACEPTAEQMTNVRSQLPAGCELLDLGAYGEIDRLVVVTCDGRQTVSTNSVIIKRTGKTTTRDAAATFILGAL